MDKNLLGPDDEDTEGDEASLIDLGAVSVETKGGIWGRGDGGAGFCIC